MNEDILRDLVGHQVEVRSNFGDGEVKDAGVLESYNLQWICIRKNAGEKLYFSILQVRLIKTLS